MPTTRVPCTGAARTWNLFIFAGVPQTTEPTSAVSGPSSPYCGDMWRRYCCLTSFFPIVDTCLSCEDTAKVVRWFTDGEFFASFLRPVIPASRVQHISYLHSKFALRPHNVQKYGRHLMWTAEIRRGKRKNTKPQGKNIMSASATHGGHNESCINKGDQTK